jgi:predicted CoA-substrate-specific enzyme activase
MAYTLGIDIGSGFSKAVVCKEKTVVAHAVMPSGGNYGKTAKSLSEIVVRMAGVARSRVSYTVATGYGAGAVDFANRSATDISCHAAGVHQLFPSVRTVVDIGAQFSKALKLDETGRVTNFVLNEKCAGGSGKFLQVIARILHMPVEDIGKLSLASTKPVDFTTGCAVFAESEAVSRISEGAASADILAGVHKAMASKVVNLVVRIGLATDCALTGGGAKDVGLVKAVEEELGVALLVPEEPQITAALGAALLGERG